jgi:hypothetical protein
LAVASFGALPKSHSVGDRSRRRCDGLLFIMARVSHGWVSRIEQALGLRKTVVLIALILIMLFVIGMPIRTVGEGPDGQG